MFWGISSWDHSRVCRLEVVCDYFWYHEKRSCGVYRLTRPMQGNKRWALACSHFDRITRRWLTFYERSSCVHFYEGCHHAQKEIGAGGLLFIRYSARISLSDGVGHPSHNGANLWLINPKLSNLDSSYIWRGPMWLTHDLDHSSPPHQLLTCHKLRRILWGLNGGANEDLIDQLPLELHAVSTLVDRIGWSRLSIDLSKVQATFNRLVVPSHR